MRPPCSFSQLQPRFWRPTTSTSLLSATSEPTAAGALRTRSKGRQALSRFLVALTASAAIAVISACMAFLATTALAASLGASSSGFGADTKVIGSCGSGMELGYTPEFNTGLSEYVFDAIDLSNIPTSCLGKRLSLTFYGTAGNAVGSAVNITLPTSGTSQNISITPNSNAIDASRVVGVSAVVR